MFEWFTADVLSRKTLSTERKKEKLKRNSVGSVQTHPSAWNLDMGTEAQWSSVQPWLILCTCIRPVSTPTLLHQHRARNCNYRKTDRPSSLGASSGCVQPLPTGLCCVCLHSFSYEPAVSCTSLLSKQGGSQIYSGHDGALMLFVFVWMVRLLSALTEKWQPAFSSAQSVLEGGGVCWGKVLQIITCRCFPNEISNEFLKRICCSQQFISIDINPARGLKLQLWLPIIIFQMLGPAIIWIISL